MSAASKEQGITLIELMVVLVLVSIGVLTLCAVQTRSFTDVHRSGRYTEALEIAEMRMETARAGGFTLATSDSGTVNGINWSCIVSNDAADLRRATVTVSWTDGEVPRSLQLVSLLSQR